MRAGSPIFYRTQNLIKAAASYTAVQVLSMGEEDGHALKLCAKASIVAESRAVGPALCSVRGHCSSGFSLPLRGTPKQHLVYAVSI
jgi:hypothetical protein